ncbi:MAG: hypothetical protein MUF66_09135, partial [Gammaproteobacteria bacterium]|nr:hypothetical protein [Gammaproteobacteria bacterium]
MRASDSSKQQRLWSITCYFNPLGYRRRRENYRIFRRHLAGPLLTVEWSRDGIFELAAGDADVLVQAAGGDLLWQKERLLNLALEALPDACEAVAWLDGDVVFARDDWREATLERLGDHALVQPFGSVHYLGPEAVSGHARTAVFRPTRSLHSVRAFASHHLLGRDVDARIDNGGNEPCTPGMAWAARRSLLQMHGFYDASICGGGDSAIAYAATGRTRDLLRRRPMSPMQREHYLAWAEGFARAADRAVGCVAGDLYHLWHGDLRDRQYRQRFVALAELAFDPFRHITLDRGGCWRW